jgi:hypothetical protein
MNRLLLLALGTWVTALNPLPLHAEVVNVATRGTASSLQVPWGSQNIAHLIDGSTTTFVHADAGLSAPLAYYVDLGAPHLVQGFRIFPRQDGCCADRLSQFRVSIHDDDGGGGVGAEVWGVDLFTDGSNPGSTAGDVVEVSVPAPGATGRHVQLLSLADPIPDYALQVSEWEVLAEVPPSEVNRALGTLAAANQPLFSGASPAALVDGNRTTQVHGPETITHPFFYTINLGTTVRLSQIVVWPRQDGCCPERLSHYRVSVHDDHEGSIGDSVWQAVIHADGWNPGSEPGSKDVLTADLHPEGSFEGQWLRIEALEDPLPSYALQIAEVEALGEPIGGSNVLISQQPMGASAGVGQTAQFSVTATVVNGDPADLEYQWRRNGSPIAGATEATYTTPPIQVEDDKAEFSCTLTFPGLPNQTTEIAILRVNLAFQAPAFSNRPLWANGGWNISMITDGNRTATLHGDTGIETGMAYEVNLGAEVNLEEIAIYPRQDGCCAERFSNVQVSVHTDNAGAIGDPVWTADLYTDGTHPGSTAGSVARITASLDADGTFQGQWIRILALDDPIPDYHLQMTEIEAYGTFVSTQPLLEILTQPVDAPGAPGRTAQLSLTARVINGNPANIGYQWFRDGTAIPGAMTHTYTTPPLVNQDTNATFHCVVSYPGIPSVQSTTAKVFFDYNYSRGQPAFSNRPLWGPGGWNISMLVDGDRLNAIHADTQPESGFAYDVDLGTEVAIERIDIYPRQDGCCPERLANFRVSVHESSGGVMGDETWSGDFFNDGSNAGSGPNTVVNIDASLGAGTFIGSWVRILALDDPIPDYFLQISEIEVIGQSTSAPQPTLNVAQTSTGITLSWSGAGFVLQSADAVEGPWTSLEGTVSPASIPFSSLPNTAQLFRLRSQ